MKHIFKHIFSLTIILSLLLSLASCKIKYDETAFPLPTETTLPTYTEKGYKVSVDDDKIILIECNVNEEYLSIPNSISGYKITSVASGCFAGLDKPRSIILSNGITKIEADAFRGCINLEFVYVPNSVTEIDANAFAGVNNERFCVMGRKSSAIEIFANANNIKFMTEPLNNN